MVGLADVIQMAVIITLFASLSHAVGILRSKSSPFRARRMRRAEIPRRSVLQRLVTFWEIPKIVGPQAHGKIAGDQHCFLVALRLWIEICGFMAFMSALYSVYQRPGFMAVLCACGVQPFFAWRFSRALRSFVPIHEAAVHDTSLAARTVMFTNLPASYKLSEDADQRWIREELGMEYNNVRQPRKVGRLYDIAKYRDGMLTHFEKACTNFLRTAKSDTRFVSAAMTRAFPRLLAAIRDFETEADKVDAEDLYLQILFVEYPRPIDAINACTKHYKTIIPVQAGIEPGDVLWQMVQNGGGTSPFLLPALPMTLVFLPRWVWKYTSLPSFYVGIVLSALSAAVPRALALVHGASTKQEVHMRAYEYGTMSVLFMQFVVPFVGDDVLYPSLEIGRALLMLPGRSKAIATGFVMVQGAALLINSLNGFLRQYISIIVASIIDQTPREKFCRLAKAPSSSMWLRTQRYTYRDLPVNFAILGLPVLATGLTAPLVCISASFFFSMLYWRLRKDHLKGPDTSCDMRGQLLAQSLTMVAVGIYLQLYVTVVHAGTRAPAICIVVAAMFWTAIVARQAHIVRRAMADMPIPDMGRRRGAPDAYEHPLIDRRGVGVWIPCTLPATNASLRLAEILRQQFDIARERGSIRSPVGVSHRGMALTSKGQLQWTTEYPPSYGMMQNDVGR